ncbi:MAG: DUF3450 domain-containing protein [Pseudomonadota bacterium]
MKRFLKPARAAFIAALLTGAAAPAFAQLANAISTGEEATRQAERTQVRINQLDDERGEMVSEFRVLLQRKDAAELYALQQARVVESQSRELESLEEQLSRIDEIKAQMYPMMEDMLAALVAFRAADLPFKQKTNDGTDIRAARYETLDGILDRADVSPAEQYRLIIDAFQAEMEYGRTIDLYQDDIVVGGEPKTVDVVRFGRVALTYVEKDQSNVGRWSREINDWEQLPGSYKNGILRAKRVADKVATPVVMMAPIEKFSAQ